MFCFKTVGNITPIMQTMHYGPNKICGKSIFKFINNLLVKRYIFNVFH